MAEASYAPETLRLRLSQRGTDREGDKKKEKNKENKENKERKTNGSHNTMVVIETEELGREWQELLSITQERDCVERRKVQERHKEDK